ncbi:MAG: hypothetical protein AB1696_27085 [Planctomycetota bacterium]
MANIVRRECFKEKYKGIYVLIVFIVLISVFALFLVGGGRQASPEKFAPRNNPNPPASAPCKPREGGANLTRFNLSNPCSLGIEDLSEVVRQWVHDNATMDDMLLAIRLWQANSSSNPSR